MSASMANPARPSTSAQDTVDPFDKDAADQAHERALQDAAKAHAATAMRPHEVGLIQGIRNFMKGEQSKASVTQNHSEDAQLGALDAASRGAQEAPGRTTDY